MRRVRALIVVGGCLGLLLLAARFLGERPPVEMDGPKPAPGQQAPQPDLPNGTEGAVEPRSREAISSGAGAPLLSGAVRAEGGEPIGGARLRWIALRLEDTEPNPVWRSLDWGWSERHARETTSRADGSFSFEGPPVEEAQHGTVLIALHEQHSAGGLDLPDAESWGRPVELVLQPAPAIVVHVVDEGGRALAGALVRHLACTGQPLSREDFTLARHRRFLANEVTADRNGRAVLAPYPGEQVLWARAGELLSVPWQGEEPGEVTLVVGQAFTLGGTLTVPEWDPGYRGERRILVSGLTGNVWRPLARLRGVEAGPWGPLPVPLRGVSRFRVRLEGSPITPMELEFAPPGAGSHRHLDLAAKVGSNIWFMVQDAAQTPVPSARAELWWTDPQEPSGAGRAEFGAMPDGRINTWSFPPGIVSYRITAPGFASSENYIEAPATNGVLVTLEKGGRITGRCLHEGHPVPDFQVVYRREGIDRDNRTKLFLARKDGRYEIDHLAPGSWLVSVASPQSPGSSPTVVRVDADRETLLDLELPAAVRGVGRVLDAQTGEPIGAALVQVYSGGLERTLPWGVPFSVGGDGSFDLDAFVLGRNFIIVSAAGFAARALESSFSGVGPLDWGEIALFRAQSLRFQLRGDPPAGLALGDLRLSGEATQPLPEKRFDSSGLATFEGVSPGSCRLGIVEPNGDWTQVDVELVHGADWSYDCVLAGPRRLEVSVTGSGGEELDYLPGVLVMAREETGAFVTRYRLTDKGRATFEGIRASRVDIEVIDVHKQTVATREARFGDSESLATRIELGERPLRIRVVDGDGQPLAGAWVRTRSRNGADLYGMDDTDADGWASQYGLPQETILLDVEHGLAGKRLGVPIEPSLRELEFVLEASGALGLLLVDGREPLANVAAWIETSDGVALSDVKVSGADGRLRFEPLGEGTYRVAARRGDCWPTVLQLSLGADEQARREVQVRRLAKVRIDVLDRGGVPVVGQAVSLESSEFACAVQEWLDARRILAPSGLVTDRLGHLWLEGLPNGPYAWSTRGSEQQASGSFVLAAGADNTVVIRLP